MPFFGAGAHPAGSIGAGIGFATPLNTTAQRLFRKADGSIGNALYVDPATADRVLDDRGIPVGNDSAPEQVRLALFTLRDSSAVKQFGLDLLGVGTFSATTAVQFEALVRDSLSHLTSRGKVSILEFLYDRFSKTGASVQVRWVDLSTGKVFLDNIGP